MVLIHIARAGQILGRYPEADLPVLVGAGTVKASDHYWKKGMAGWVLVGTTFDPPKPKPATPPPATPPPRSCGTWSKKRPLTLQLRCAWRLRGTMMLLMLRLSTRWAERG